MSDFYRADSLSNNTSQNQIPDPFDEDPRKRQEMRMRATADTLYKSVFGIQAVITRFDHSDKLILDTQYAIDMQITLPSSNMILLGQEKFLSPEYKRFESVTVEYYQVATTGEHGDWYKLAAQLYFVGYCTLLFDQFDPWILLNWPAVVIATERGTIKWNDNRNRDGHARASFRWVAMKDIPANCVIASSKSNTLPDISLLLKQLSGK